MADQVVAMSQGRVEQTGPPQDIYHQPANPFVADFIGRANFVEGQCEAGRFTSHGIVLDLEGASFLDRAPIVVAVRPEKACIDQPTPEVNQIPAKVSFVRDVGATRDIHVDTALGGFVVEYAIGENARPYRVGDTVSLHLPPSALLVYPRARSEAA